MGGTACTVNVDPQDARALERYFRARTATRRPGRPLWLGVNGRGPLAPTGFY